MTTELPANERDSAYEQRLGAAFVRLTATVSELRRRCPWDREQTLASLAKYLPEEAFEAADAIRRNALDELAEELGDVIAQTLMQATVGAECGNPEIDVILENARAKLIRRHPHVYASERCGTAEQVLASWRRIKADERARTGHTSAVDGVARALPGLMRAEKLGQRAREAGMDWSEARAVLAKVREELDEIDQALDSGRSQQALEEAGDALLALANLPRFLDGDAEGAIASACDKFIERFKRVEQIARERGLQLEALEARAIDQLWREAKTAG